MNQVLDLAKVHMYRLHTAIVDRMARQGVSCQLLYHDTDSLLMSVTTLQGATIVPAVELFHADAQLRDLLDWSSMPSAHPLHSDTNRMVPGKLKVENADRVAVAFCGLRPKLYAVQYNDDETTIKAAGVPGARSLFGMRDYLACLKEVRGRTVSFPVNRSEEGRLETVSTISTRIGMSALDAKLYIMVDGISTRPHGHYLNVA
jgi:hypothetical protein